MINPPCTIADVGLVGLQRSEFARASKAQTYAGWAQVGVAIAGIVASLSDDNLLDFAIAGLAACAALAAFYFSTRHDRIRAYAGRVRRATLVADGFGRGLIPSEENDIRVKYGGQLEEAIARDDKEYFASKEAGGWTRVANNIAESAFWTEDLFHHSATRQFVAAGGYLLLTVVLLYAVLAVGDPDQIRTATQTFCAVLVLIVSKDQLGAALAYQDGERRVRDVVQRIAAKDLTDCEIMLIWGDYNAAVEGTPLVPNSVYERRKETINALWRSRAST